MQRKYAVFGQRVTSHLSNTQIDEYMLKKKLKLNKAVEKNKFFCKKYYILLYLKGNALAVFR